jgi:hypothetical protein
MRDKEGREKESVFLKFLVFYKRGYYEQLLYSRNNLYEKNEKKKSDFLFI